MNLLFFLKKKKQLQLLTNFYHSLQGEPFLIEEVVLDGDLVKVEFYYLEQSKHYSTLFQSRQFAIWTADQGSYRLLIDKDYYQHFAPLYQKEINVFWLTFMIRVYQKEISLINRIKFVFLFVLLPTLLLIFLTIQKWQKLEKKWFFVVPLVILLTVSFIVNYWIKNQQKQLIFFKDKELQKALEEIKKKLGESFFAELLEKQKNYKPPYVSIKNEGDNDTIF
ncbi:putative membrane protein [Candidatus Phytoplasma solani]|uniref:hypothetical protein n=1 Tax=Candidatus Phytoplasma solani TaxID=69896 RepID=UPI0032DB82B7